MITYVAMLRGINVAGHKLVKMDQLRASFEKMGFRDAETYVQSGNVVFKASEKSAAKLVEVIGQGILKDFGFEVSVLVRTAAEMERIVRDSPYLKDSSVDRSKLHVTFLSGTAPKGGAKALESLAAKEERLQIEGREIYLYCPNGYGRTKLSNDAIERKLGVGATTRNWNSVNALLAMAQGRELINQDTEV